MISLPKRYGSLLAGLPGGEGSIDTLFGALSLVAGFASRKGFIFGLPGTRSGILAAFGAMSLVEGFTRR